MTQWHGWMHDGPQADQRRRLTVMVILLLVLVPLVGLMERNLHRAMTLPSAWLASFFVGSECVETPEGYMLPNSSLPVHVTSLCGAMAFFCLLLAMMAATVVKSFRPRDFAALAWVLPAAYIITIFANSARIASSWFTGQLARRFLPQNLWAGVHMGTGVVVFVTFLCTTYLVLTWSSYGKWRRSQTAGIG